MACTIVATAGATNANGYATVADGDTYHQSHPYPDVWLGAGSDDKCRALVLATRLLDTWFEWDGDTASSTQALLWPRMGAIGPNGYELDSDEIPTIIENATIELARHLLAGDRTADSDVETQGLRSLTAGPVTLTFGDARAKPIPDSVMVMASQLGRARSRMGVGAVHMYRA